MQIASAEYLPDPENNKLVYFLLINSLSDNVGRDISLDICTYALEFIVAKSARRKFYIKEEARDGIEIMEIMDSGVRATGYVLHEKEAGKFLLYTRERHEQIRRECPLDPHMSGVIIVGTIVNGEVIEKMVNRLVQEVGLVET